MSSSNIPSTYHSGLANNFSNNNTNEFGHNNRAINMDPVTVPPSPYVGSNELLLNAQLSLLSASQVDLYRMQSSALAAAASQHASLVQMRNPGSIVAALQRRHRSTIAEAAATEMSLRNRNCNSFVKTSPVSRDQPVTTETKKSSAAAPPSCRSTHSFQEVQDEQNACELNPSAFQFPWKVHDMLDRSKIDGNEKIVSWVDNGEAFRVHLPDEFVENIMPHFFKQTKYKSFQRQLNLYGFTRIHNGPNKGGYKHKYFRQGQRIMCQLIMRCPVRDGSSAATSAAANEAASKEINEKIITDKITDNNSIDNDNSGAVGTSSERPNARMTPLASMSHSSNEPPQSSLTNMQQQLEQTDGLPRNPQYHSQHMMMPTNLQNALTNTINIMRLKQEEQQLHQLRELQSKTEQRLQRLNQLQGEQESLTSGFVPGMSLAGIGQCVGNDKNSITFGKELQFPWKLYEVLQRSDENGFSHLVSWMPGGACFKVHNVENFVKSVMPSFFKQTKYKSFQRQLNLYGFDRVESGPHKGGYCHPNFIKGRKHLLDSIVRVRVKGNGKARTDKGGVVPTTHLFDVGSSENYNSDEKYDIVTRPQSSTAKQGTTTSAVPSSPETNSAKSSGIDVILEAIKTREQTVCEHSDDVQNIVHYVNDAADNNSRASSSSSSTRPSIIDVKMKDTMYANNAYGFSWRQNPSESYSDWTIEVISDDAPPDNEGSVYDVHRRVLAVGPKKSDYFARIFKSNGATNRNQLRLTRDQAAIFPQVLDYIYADVDFDMDAEKAYTLYSLGERIENESIVQTVTDFYDKCCITKDNAVDFIKLGEGFTNKTLFNTAVRKCAKEIWSLDVEKGAKIKPGVLYQVLVLVMSQDRGTPKYNAVRLSQIVATCVSNATRITLTPEIFRSLTDKSLLPSVHPIAAIKLLATENALVNGNQGSPLAAGDPSLRERCISAIRESWQHLRKSLSENHDLANTMRSICPIVLFDILMKTTKCDDLVF